MSISNRLAELQELFIALGAALAVLAVVAWLVGTFRVSKTQAEIRPDPSPVRKAQMQFPAKTGRAIPAHKPIVSGLYVTTDAGQPMERVEFATAVTGRGLVGDRYFSEKGHWSGTDECEVTIITQERLDDIEKRWGVKIQNGEHRRNIVISNLPIESLTGRRFNIGSALFGYERPRPPCAYITMITEPGMTKALGKDAGICVRCIKGGEVRHGDEITISTITLAQALKYRARLMLKQWLNTSIGHD